MSSYIFSFLFHIHRIKSLHSHKVELERWGDGFARALWYAVRNSALGITTEPKPFLYSINWPRSKKEKPDFSNNFAIASIWIVPTPSLT